MHELIMANKVIPYTIKKSKRAKHVNISVGPDGVKVVAPLGVGDGEIIPLIEKRREWIFDKIKTFKSLKTTRVERRLVSGEELPFKGEDFTLRVMEYDGRYTKVVFDGQRFLVYVKKDISTGKRREEIKKRLEQWYKGQARRLIHERLDFYKQQMDLDFNEVRLKDQKTRWGSCSTKGNLNFNWRLIMAPPFILDYVIVHELCHLKIMNHTKQFWQLVESCVPDYKARRNWLKENGMGLSL